MKQSTVAAIAALGLFVATFTGAATTGAIAESNTVKGIGSVQCPGGTLSNHFMLTSISPLKYVGTSKKKKTTEKILKDVKTKSSWQVTVSKQTLQYFSNSGWRIISSTYIYPTISAVCTMDVPSPAPSPTPTVTPNPVTSPTPVVSPVVQAPSNSWAGTTISAPVDLAPLALPPRIEISGSGETITWAISADVRRPIKNFVLEYSFDCDNWANFTFPSVDTRTYSVARNIFNLPVCAYRLAAENANGRGDRSEPRVLNATARGTLDHGSLPQAPTNVVKTAGDDSRIALSWLAPTRVSVATPKSFVIEVQTGSDIWYRLGTVPLSQNRVNVPIRFGSDVATSIRVGVDSTHGIGKRSEILSVSSATLSLPNSVVANPGVPSSPSTPTFSPVVPVTPSGTNVSVEGWGSIKCAPGWVFTSRRISSTKRNTIPPRPGNYGYLDVDYINTLVNGVWTVKWYRTTMYVYLSGFAAPKITRSYFSPYLTGVCTKL